MQITEVPFRPIHGSTLVCAATTTSASYAIPASALGATVARVAHVTGTDRVRWRDGVGVGTTAVIGDTGQFPTTAESFSINAGSTYIAVKTDSGTGTLEFTFGVGA